MTVFAGYVWMEGQTGEKKSPVPTLHFKALSFIPSFVVWRSYFCFTQFHDSSTVRLDTAPFNVNFYLLLKSDGRFFFVACFSFT